MTKLELRNEITEIENNLIVNQWSLESSGEDKKLKASLRKLKKQIKTLTPAIVAGGTYSIDDFADTLNYSGKKDTPEKKFFKEESRRYDKQELEVIKKMVGYNQALYNYFNKMYSPIPETIKRVVLAERQEEVKSSNIYDRMCAKSEADVMYEFQIRPGYNKEPITITKNVTENTTLSQRDVYSFM